MSGPKNNRLPGYFNDPHTTMGGAFNMAPGPLHPSVAAEIAQALKKSGLPADMVRKGHRMLDAWKNGGPT